MIVSEMETEIHIDILWRNNLKRVEEILPSPQGVIPLRYNINTKKSSIFQNQVLTIQFVSDIIKVLKR